MYAAVNQNGSKRQPGGAKNDDVPEKGIWSSMLDSVSSGRKLPQKNLMIFGGTPVSQRDFLEVLNSDVPKRLQDRQKSKRIIANDYALGYTYLDVLDTDHEDILARLSIYLLADPLDAFAPLVSPLLTPATIPENLLVLLLDWSEPWAWIRQLRDWISYIRRITASLDDEAKQSLEITMQEWREKKRGLTTTFDAASGTGASNGDSGAVSLPLTQGEWDEPIGVPLCVVCQNVDQMNNLEVEHGWQEEDFDYVLQFLRTILMKHGASLIYTSVSSPNSAPRLIHSSLGIHSMLKKQAIRHDVINRDKILVPPHWDSWGKIRVLREGFDVEGTSSRWSAELEKAMTRKRAHESKEDAEVDSSAEAEAGAEAGAEADDILSIYASTVRCPPSLQIQSSEQKGKAKLELVVPDMQTFLASQQEVLARLATEDEQAAVKSSSEAASSTISNDTNRVISDQIGPVQVNMGGIQVDADDMVRKLQQSSRNTATKTGNVSTPTKGGSGSTASDISSGQMNTPELKASTDALQNFFTGLINRGASNSPRGGTPVKDKDTPGGTKLSR